MDLKDKVYLRMRQVGISDFKELAEKAGISYNGLQNILHGRRGGRRETLDAIAKALGFNSWAEFELWDPEGPKIVQEPTIKIPLYEEAVPAGFPNNLGQVEVEEFIELPESIARMLGIPTDGSAFAVRVHGDSMYPRLEDGQIAVFRKNPPFILGRIYIVRTADGEVTIKRVLGLEGDKVVLKPENPAYPILRIPAQEVALLGILVASMKKEDF